jgi:subtilisin family serine protease
VNRLPIGAFNVVRALECNQPWRTSGAEGSSRCAVAFIVLTCWLFAVVVQTVRRPASTEAEGRLHCPYSACHPFRRRQVVPAPIQATRRHPDLVGNNGNVSGVNLTASGTWDSDENSHGTHVAGTIAAIGGNGVGVVGVNPGGHLKLYIAKVFDASGSTPSSTVMDAVAKCADAGANIISMSLGGGDPSQAERRVFRSLLNDGVLTIAAAGNAGDNSTSYPAGYEEVVSVGALDANKVRADFSQVNNDVEIAAPGVATLSTIPPNLESLGKLTVAGVPYDAAAMTGSPRLSATAPLYKFGLGTAVDAGAAGKVCLIQRGVITFADKVLNCQSSGGVAAVVYNSLGRGMLFGTLGGAVTSIQSIGTSNAIGDVLVGLVGSAATVSVVPDPALYAYFSGTSMATPHVSGVAALAWSHFPKCSAKQIARCSMPAPWNSAARGRIPNSASAWFRPRPPTIALPRQAVGTEPSASPAAATPGPGGPPRVDEAVGAARRLPCAARRLVGALQPTRTRPCSHSVRACRENPRHAALPAVSGARLRSMRREAE